VFSSNSVTAHKVGGKEGREKGRGLGGYFGEGLNFYSHKFERSGSLNEAFESKKERVVVMF